jgi:hypothetical protein
MYLYNFALLTGIETELVRNFAQPAEFLAVAA